MKQVEQAEWISIAQAAREFGRTRQAIDDLIKKGLIESKPLGPKAIKHVHKPSLAMRYSMQAATAAHTQNTQASDIPIRTHSPEMELLIAKLECKRLTELLARIESDLSREQEKTKELSAQIREFEKERSQHLAELRALLSGKTDGVLSRWFRR